MSFLFRDTDIPNVHYRVGTEDPIPWVFEALPHGSSFYRYITARPTKGRPQTDATFWHEGTSVKNMLSTHVLPYKFWPLWKQGLLITRAPHQLGAWALLGYGLDRIDEVFPLGWSHEWWANWETPATAALPVAGWWAWRGVTAAQNHKFDRAYVRPLTNTLINTLRTRDGIKVRIPRDIVGAEKPGPTGRIFLPPTFVGSDGERDDILEACRGRLSSTALDARWHMEGSRPFAELFVPPQPPELVPREMLLEKWSPDRPYLGESATGAVRWDIGESSPHFGVAGASMSGKSELTGVAVAQLMRGGAGAVVLDPKDTSHRWLMDMSGVLYCGSLDLADGIMAVDAELLRRKLANKEASRDIDFPRLVVLLEERNSMQEELRQQFNELPTSEKNGRSSHPAIAALNRLSSQGRTLNIIVILAGQETAQQHIGSRSNFSSWALAGKMGPNHWRTVGGPGTTKPGMSDRPGSFGDISNGVITPYQAVFANLSKDPEWLAEFATGGNPSWDTRRLMGTSSQDAREGTNPSSEPVTTSQLRPDDTVELVTLSDMVRPGLAITRLRAWGRDGKLPPVQGTGNHNAALYNRADMEALILRLIGETDES